MKQAIEIVEELLSETIMSKYIKGSECMAARNALSLAIQRLKSAEAQKAKDAAELLSSAYFKHQKGLLDGNNT